MSVQFTRKNRLPESGVQPSLAPIDRFRRGADKVMREASVVRLKDKLTQIQSEPRNRFRKHVTKAKDQNGMQKTVRIADSRVISESASGSTRTNTASTCSVSASSNGNRLINEDVLLDTMTQGDLQKRLTSLGGANIMAQVKDRSLSASRPGTRHGKGPGLERETTFPGHNPNSRRYPTSLINWAMSVASGDSRGSATSSFEESTSPAMNFLLRRYSVNEEHKARAKSKVREKISNKLELPTDRITRLATLRSNVRFIEGKFKSLLNKQRTVDNKDDKSSIASVAPDDYGNWPSRFTKPGQAYAFFRSRTQMILICMRWIRMVMEMNKNSSWEKELKSLVDLTAPGDRDFTDMTSNAGFTQFDKNEFKANKEISLSFDVRTILSLRPEARTPSMLNQVMLGLQTLQSLSEYPLDTQEQLCKVAWFQQVPARKYIIRQGHRPEAFYFILSGQAIVKKIEQDEVSGEETTKVVARLSKGQSFGELGLIFKTPRNATVESGSPMDLLVVGKSDFLKIFMHNVKPGEDPDHIAYLKQQPILRHWPFEALKEDPGSCLINYFKRGTLITDNGKASEWIYFVKSGSCVALKRLKAVTPRTERQLKRKRRNSKAKDFHLPDIPSKVVTQPRVAEKEAVHPELLRSMTDYFDEVRNSVEENRRAARAISSSRVSVSKSPAADNSFLTIPDIVEPPRMNSTHVYFKRTPPREDVNPCPLPSIPARSPDGPGISKSKFGHFSQHNMGKSHFNVPTNTSLKRTFTERCLTDHDQLEADKEDKEDIFVTVEKLQPRDVFGMNTVSFSDDEENNSTPEVALVSKGAEIVMLSKKLFQKHADERTKLAVQELSTPYPLEETLQENLQIKADWTLYRHQVLHDVMSINYELRQHLSGVV